MENFNQIFKSPKSHKMGVKLKEIIESHFDNIEGNIYGGAKVKLVLYSRNGKNNVLCGIQEGSNESCMLFVHHVDEINHERLKFSGKGKHAKRIKFNAIDDIIEEDIKWLLSKVNENAPF
jgi:homoserine kinase